MSDHTVNRRQMCKTLLACGTATLTGAVAYGQQPPRSQDAEELEQRLLDAARRGATMEEIAKLRDPIATTPAEALRALKTGNARFFGGQARRPEMSAAERRAQILGQTPFAVVLSCADSRVPTEIVFDQSLGSLFITRVAGNVVDSGTLGSIEYGIEHLKTHLVVIMGHEGCGAIKAALLPAAERAKETPSIQALLDQIVPSVANIPKIRDEKAKMREAVIANVRQQVQNVKKSASVQRGVARKSLAVIGAFYEITSGAVDFFETEEELRLAQTSDHERWRAHLG